MIEMGDCLNCKSLDNRVSVFILIEMFREMKKKHGESFYLNNPIKFNNLDLANNSSAQKLDADKKEVTKKSFWEDN